MDLLAELSCDGVPPTGPVSAWPQDRHYELIVGHSPKAQVKDKKVKASWGQMAKGVVNNAKQAVVHGKVTEEIRNERYETCKACPHFIEDSKRCSECGCFMEAKTWIGGDPKLLCPKKKWSR